MFVHSVCGQVYEYAHGHVYGYACVYVLIHISVHTSMRTPLHICRAQANSKFVPTIIATITAASIITDKKKQKMSCPYPQHALQADAVLL